MARAKVSLSQIQAEVKDFDIEKIKPFLAQRNIIVPDYIKTKEEFDYWLIVWHTVKNNGSN